MTPIPAPGVGCGAAIWLDGRLLLVERRKPPEVGYWNLPGGNVDFGERVEGAIRSDIAEEIGVEIALTQPLGLVEMLSDGQRWAAPIYAARILAGDPINREPDDHEALIRADPAASPSPLTAAADEALARGPGA